MASGLIRGRPESRQLLAARSLFLAVIAVCRARAVAECGAQSGPGATAAPPALLQPTLPPRRRSLPQNGHAVPVPTDEVRAYLWSVYQRSPAKADGHGDFTWKDITAAARIGLSIEEYVIGGIDPDFREVLYAVGHAMDAAGVEWTILSGFRDDFRQKMASGLKAKVNNSFHGGSAATGGYAHGCAVDLASADRLDDYRVWRWVDKNARDLALHRPLQGRRPRTHDPAAGMA